MSVTPIAHLHTVLVQTLIDDRLREADEYRRGREARRAITARGQANERRHPVARLLRGQDERAPLTAIGRRPLRLASVGRRRVRSQDGRS